MKLLKIFPASGSAILFMALLLFSPSVHSAMRPGAYFWGDADGNGTIDINDITEIKNAFKGSGSDYTSVVPSSGYTQDLSGDNSWPDINDITLLKDYFRGDYSPKPGNPVSIVIATPDIQVSPGESVDISAYVVDSATASDGKRDPRAGWGVVFRVNTGPGLCQDVSIRGRDVLPQGAQSDSDTTWFPNATLGNTAEAFAYTLDADTPYNGLATVRLLVGPGCSQGDSIEVEVFVPSDTEARIGQSRNPGAIGPISLHDSVGGCTDGDGDGYYFDCDPLDCDDSHPAHWLDCGDCVDEDGDGYGVDGSDCDLYQLDDCADYDPSVNPDEIEICGDGIDQNCNGMDIEPWGMPCYECVCATVFDPVCVWDIFGYCWMDFCDAAMNCMEALCYFSDPSCEMMYPGCSSDPCGF